MKFQSSNVLYRPPLPNSNQFTYSANSQYNLQTMPQDNFQIKPLSKLRIKIIPRSALIPNKLQNKKVNVGIISDKWKI